ncbi:Altered inheritance of mitochondria protein 6 [Myotisia sp. PD_48]|nr:Altered inheritance of mitochondria protein 6 [Myotisia sp. PD_48]
MRSPSCPPPKSDPISQSWARVGGDGDSRTLTPTSDNELDCSEYLYSQAGDSSNSDSRQEMEEEEWRDLEQQDYERYRRPDAASFLARSNWTHLDDLNKEETSETSEKEKHLSCTEQFGKWFLRRPQSLRGFLLIIVGWFVLLGIAQFILIVVGIILACIPSGVDNAVAHWGKVGPSQFLFTWPTKFSRDIQPVNCHSHNDYWREAPLFSAIQVGCTSVEADIWLFDQELYIGHTRASLTANRTLKGLYINPLVDILEKQNQPSHFYPLISEPPNGIFDTDPSRSLILLVDMKTNGEEVLPYLYQQLSPLREKKYLTHFNGSAVVQGPVTVVATGNAPFDLLRSNSTYRDVFFDAPLDNLAGYPAPDTKEGDDPRNTSYDSLETSQSPYNTTNSYYASASFMKTVGFPWFHLTDKQLKLIRTHVAGAHRLGLRVRYWDIPAWPRFIRNFIWTNLVTEGVDMLNADDIRAAAELDWTRISWLEL